VLFMVFLLIAAVAGGGCLLALGFGVAALSADRRAGVVSKYPLRAVTWSIAAPFFAFSVAGSLFGLSVASDGGDGFALLAGILCVAAAVACVVAIAMCSRAAKGKYARGPWAPAVLGFGAPLVPMVLGLVSGTGELPGILGLVLAAGAGVNGLLAVRVNDSVRVGELSTTELPAGV